MSGPNTKGTRPQPRPLTGDEGAKRSAALILEVLAGLRTPSEASTALGVTTMRYYVLERRGPGGGGQAPQPRPEGGKRPPGDAPHEGGGLDGPEDLKWRLRVLLETIVGSISVTQACEELGVSESRLHELRRQALVGALGALMPKPAGRPATAETTTAREKDLETRIQELEVDLQAALVRTELALAMPELFRGRSKKNRG